MLIVREDDVETFSRHQAGTGFSRYNQNSESCLVTSVTVDRKGLGFKVYMLLHEPMLSSNILHTDSKAAARCE